MAKFVFAYHGGSMAQTDEERQAAMAAWGQWFGRLGSAITDPGNPTGAAKTVTSEGVSDDRGANPLTGYTLIEAADLGAAADLARDCPVLERGGSVEVVEAIPIEM